MRRKLSLVGAGLMLVVLGGWAGQLELVPSEPFPAPGTEVGLQVIGAPAGASFYWDWGGDGTVDAVTQSPLASYFVRPGYQEIVVQVILGGQAWGSTRLALMVDERLVAYRSIEPLSSGALEVSVTLRVLENLFAPGIKEAIPAGWAVEVIDPQGAAYKISDFLYAVWALELLPGNELVFTYILHPLPGAGGTRLSGWAKAWGTGQVEVQIGGEIIVP